MPTFSNRLWRLHAQTFGVLISCAGAALASFYFRTAGGREAPDPVLGAHRGGSTAMRNDRRNVGDVRSLCHLCRVSFSPIGKLSVADTDQRLNLAWFLLGGLAISFLFGTSNGDRANITKSRPRLAEPGRGQAFFERSQDPVTPAHLRAPLSAPRSPPRAHLPYPHSASRRSAARPALRAASACLCGSRP